MIWTIRVLNRIIEKMPPVNWFVKMNTARKNQMQDVMVTQCWNLFLSQFSCFTSDNRILHRLFYLPFPAFLKISELSILLLQYTIMVSSGMQKYIVYPKSSSEIISYFPYCSFQSLFVHPPPQKRGVFSCKFFQLLTTSTKEK